MKKVLVAPLDWGLGHATRSIPVVQALLEAGFEVILAADGAGKMILQEAFPSLQIITLKGYNLRYSTTIPAWLKVLIQIPKILSASLREHKELKRIIKLNGIDCVISDNRFGFWNKKVFSVYITHQVLIKCPRGFRFAEPLLRLLHRGIISRYNECWIPDAAGSKNLSGRLGHPESIPAHVHYIGPLSRFQFLNLKDKTYDVCFILSGPEPGRSEFEKKVFDLLKNYKGATLVVLGKPEQSVYTFRDNVTVVSHLKTKKLERAILSSERIVCRSGYSSIMDLVALRKTALLVPTPGQTEQEYLAEYLSSKKLFSFVRQSKLRIETITSLSDSYNEFVVDNSGLKRAVAALKDSLHNTRV